MALPLLLGAACSGGIFYALENKLVQMPPALLQFTEGRPNWQVAVAVGGLVALLISLAGAGGAKAEPAASGKKKKKKKAAAGGGDKAAAPDAASSKPKVKAAQTAQVAAKPAAKKATNGGGEEDKPKSKKAAKKAKKAANAAAKEEAAAKKEAPEKKKSGPKPKLDAVGSNKWAVFGSDDDDSDDAPRHASSASGAGHKSGGGGGGGVDAHYDNDEPQGMSKSALRRRRKAENKSAFGGASGGSSKPNQPDEDGWTTQTTKKRVRKTPAQKAAAEAESAQAEASAASPTAASTIELNVPASKYGLLIGPKGATLNQIQDVTGVRVEIPREESGKSTVTVSGGKEAVQRAKKCINDLVKQGFSSILDPTKTSASISVEPRALGVVIGPGGSNIKRLQEVLGVRVNTPDRNSESNKVTISGEKDAVRQAREAIKQLVDDGFSSITHPGFVKEWVDFPPNEFHILIGPGGHTVKSIMGDTRTKIGIPRNNDEDERVSIVGLKADVQRAKVQIDRLLDEDYQAAKLAKKGIPAVAPEDDFDW